MNNLAFFKGKKVFLTGHTGFKGSWLSRILILAGAEVTGYALEAPKEAKLFDTLQLENNMHSVIGDIRDREKLISTMQEAQPEIVLHLAAQPIVRESYKDPVATYETNVMGTVNILEAVRQTKSVKSFLNVTTDKVYKNNEWEWGYRETDELDGYDPYSNSKSCSELVTHSYEKSFLKEAGVVDSGGQGLLEVLHGAYDAFLGKEIDYSAIEATSGTTMVKPGQQAETDIKFGYCTEFIIMLEKEFTSKDEAEFKAYLESIGDSIVCVADDDVVKIHVHTNDPGLAIQKALTFGQLSRMKIDNMREEHQEKLIKDAEKVAAQQAENKKKEPRKPVGFITVSIGDGMNDIFKELGVDYIIEGGQTMNPSTEDMLTAIDHVNADHIFILPNNKNIILAANQAQSLTEDKDIIVIPTKTVPQGITAIINYMPEADVDTNIDAMNEGIKAVKTGQVTYAVRDTRIDDKEIHEGDIMGIGDAGILAVGQSVEETTKEMLADLVDEDTELISLYYGQDVLAEDAERFSAEIEELYPDVDVDVHSGGQPIYYYVLSVE